ncbi:MAG: hypothetical protein O6928_07090 [Gammaproteobacteria bacterium]|nr:hypothetical protein [Gammaproteobacteria bacterium]
MTTLTHNKYLQMMTITDDDRKVPFEHQEIRELCPNEIESVSGGFNWDNAIMNGFVTGGAIGSVFGAVATGSSAGFATYGALGAVVGFSFGSGWAVGSYLYRLNNP